MLRQPRLELRGARDGVERVAQVLAGQAERGEDPVGVLLHEDEELYVPRRPRSRGRRPPSTLERPDRKFVTGTIATSSIEVPGVAEGVGPGVAVAVGAGSAVAAGVDARAHAALPRRRRSATVTRSRTGCRRSRRRCPRRSRADPHDERDDERGREPRGAARGRHQAAFGGCTGGRGRSRAAAYRSRPDRAPGRRTPRPGGRTGRRKKRLEMADPTGFEPAISSVTGWHVGPLHHGSSAGGGS